MIAAQNEARRPALHQEHRPSRAQLRGDIRTVARADEAERHRHRRAGHAALRHAARQGLDGYVPERHRAPSPELRRGERAREHTPAASRGYSGGKGPRGTLRQAARAVARELPRRLPAVEGWEDNGRGGGKRVRDAVVYFPL